jgi:hypothetical protein
VVRALSLCKYLGLFTAGLFGCGYGAGLQV